MSSTHAASQCDRKLNAHDQFLHEMHFDEHERICLDISRLFFSTFATAATHNWIRAFEFAEHVFDHEKGPVMATLILKVIQSIRTSRTSVFMFSNPDCSGCADILSEHERRLITAIACARRGRLESAQVELMMLCEGNDTSKVMAWLAELALALPRPCPAHDAKIKRHLEQDK